MGMYVQEIIDYIKRVSLYNLDEETIRSNLLTAGNSEQDIQSALEAVKREQKNLNNKTNIQNIQIVTPATAHTGGNASIPINPAVPLPSPVNTVSFTSYDNIRKSQESYTFLKSLLKALGVILGFVFLFFIYNLYGKGWFEEILGKVFFGMKKLQK